MCDEYGIRTFSVWLPNEGSVTRVATSAHYIFQEHVAVLKYV